MSRDLNWLYKRELPFPVPLQLSCCLSDAHVTSAQNYFVAPEFAMDAESALSHHQRAEKFRHRALLAFSALDDLKPRCDV